MTPQQIAEKVYPKPTDARLKDTKAQERDELILLLTTLQKETWERACKATIEKAIDECGDYQTDELGKVENLLKVIELPPFNLDK